MTGPIVTPKPQFVRLLDVALIGPLMVIGGRQLKADSPWLGLSLGIFGYGTIAYNAWNYMAVRSEQLRRVDPQAGHLRRRLSRCPTR